MNPRVSLVDAGYRGVVRPLLFASHHGDPESVHEQMIGTLARFSRSPGLVAAAKLLAGSRGVPTTVAGIDFPGRVGLAAGMDKDGRAVLAWQALGFGFAELGTVTAQAQPGNDKPRVFRLRTSKALINRMGFNNAGAERLHRELSLLGVYRGNGGAGIPIGISIGKTKIVPVADAVDDYLASLDLVIPHADYVAINVSSPNTPGLRSLQDGGALLTLLKALVERAAGRAPLFVKIAPDLTEPQIDEVLAAATDAGVAGLIATNTTLSRDGIDPAEQSLAGEAGGLSGAPLTVRAREVVGYLVRHTDLPVIAAGGIMTADDASAMFDLGAPLVQLYTGFIYAGPALPARINALTRRNP
ncbi:MAG: quinone-dependent dihydroorotate dehydrogenase [Micropruina sp.]|uniref:quinone-dependent dihydroorotate dehydrogenase n=1 Tax=Micropruina sp. TaxID=2737536 RepID=UPI0039E6AC9A